jgi:hypothetical protein
MLSPIERAAGGIAMPRLKQVSKAEASPEIQELYKDRKSVV